MNPLDFFRQLFEYDYWGNREALASVRALSGAADRPLKLLNHIVGAERIWLGRFEPSGAPGGDPWPALPLPNCAAAIEELYLGWRRLLAGFTAERLSEALSYRSTQGREFKTPVRDVLLHLVMHSAYHRGQIAAAVREAGGRPAATDYIVWVRQAQAATAESR